MFTLNDLVCSMDTTDAAALCAIDNYYYYYYYYYYDTHTNTCTHPRMSHQLHSSISPPIAIHLSTTCPPSVHHLFTICSPPVHHVCTTCSPRVHHLSPRVHHVCTTYSTDCVFYILLYLHPLAFSLLDKFTPKGRFPPSSNSDYNDQSSC